MSGSIQGRKVNRTAVPAGGLRGAGRPQPGSATRRSGNESIRVIGRSIDVVLPSLDDVRLRYCSHTEEQPAAILGKSMLRLGLCRANDWTGSAVDFVHRGLARHCKSNGLPLVSRMFEEAYIKLGNDFLEWSEYERDQGECDGPSSRMFVTVNYERAEMIQIRPTLALMRSIDERLPAAFFVVLAHNLSRWMRVYDFRDAETYAEDQMGCFDDEEINESFYPEVKAVRPPCLDNLPSYKSAVRLVQELQPKLGNSCPASILERVLEMHEHGGEHEHAWPGLLRNTVPEMEDYLENRDEPGPGALIVFDEDDPIEACFTEQVQYLGHDQPMCSSIMLLINLDQNSESIDKDVKAAFGQMGAMIRSLASASTLIETIRGIYCENVRKVRIQQTVSAEPCPAGIRGE